MFSSLKVIDASTVLAGPSVGMFFAELGAEVIKVEHPTHKDVTRTWKLSTEDPSATVSAYFSSINYRKLYIELNLTDSNDHSVFVSLLKDADILLTNFKKGDAEKFQLTEAQLTEINPQLIHGKISGFGEESDRVAYDLILQAESGLMAMNGTETSGPVKMPVAFIDVLAAHQLKEGILVALLDRIQSGKGKTVRVSLYDAAICSLINQASGYLMEGAIPKRMGSLHPTIAPYGEIFKTKDGKEITFAIGSDSHFTKLVHFLGLEHLATDERFQTNQNRVIHRKLLFSLLEKNMQAHTASAILTWMEKYCVPCGIIKTLDEVFQADSAQKFIRTEQIDGVETKRMSSIAFQS
jgi:crotonobetainyl-CoA:carnitine CoA-transferase CaiB-like acyl-CoA transferase